MGAQYIEPGIFLRIRDEELACLICGELSSAVFRRPSSHTRSLSLMRVIDWHVGKGQPLPVRVRVLLARTLEIRRRQRAQHHADTARQLSAEGRTALEIAARLGLSYDKPDSAKQAVRRLRKADGRPDYGWSNADDVVAAVRQIGDADLSPKVRQRLYDAVAWFSDRGEPLPYIVWWAVVCALGLGRGVLPVVVRRGVPSLPLNPATHLGHYGFQPITEGIRAEAEADYRALGWAEEVIEAEIAALGPTVDEIEAECAELGLSREETERALKGLAVVRGEAAYGLTDATIAALCDGLRKPDGFLAAARAVGRARARYNPPRRFTGCEPLTPHAVAKAVADGTRGADQRRGVTDTGSGDRRDSVEAWMKRPDWDLACKSHEAVARFHPKHYLENIPHGRWQPRPETSLRMLAVHRVASARSSQPGEHKYCQPFTIRGFAKEMGVHILVVIHWLKERRRVGGEWISAWEADIAVQHPRRRALRAVAERRSRLSASRDFAFRGCYPLKPEKLALRIGVNVELLQAWIADSERWESDLAELRTLYADAQRGDNFSEVTPIVPT